MSAIDPLKRVSGRQRFRAIETARPDVTLPESRRQRGATVLKCSYRPSDADFYCWKYGVWYNTSDCCYRHARRTFQGCADCDQGASNVRVRRGRVVL